MAPISPVPPCHGTGCFFAPPRKSEHILSVFNTWLYHFSKSIQKILFSKHSVKTIDIIYFKDSAYNLDGCSSWQPVTTHPPPNFGCISTWPLIWWSYNLQLLNFSMPTKSYSIPNYMWPCKTIMSNSQIFMFTLSILFVNKKLQKNLSKVWQILW